MPFRLYAVMLGRFELWVEPFPGEEGERRVLSLPTTTRSQSLLAYLLLHRDRPHTRDVLAEMFWPGRAPSRARRSLSTALWRIRRSFAPLEPLQHDRQSVQWTFPGQVWVDVEAFEVAVREATTMAALEQALSLIRRRVPAGMLRRLGHPPPRSCPGGASAGFVEAHGRV